MLGDASLTTSGFSSTNEGSKSEGNDSVLTETKIYLGLADIEQRLAELDLEIDELQDVVRHCSLAIATQTSDHPSWGRGITVASETVFALRGRLKEKGWYAQEEQGFALTIHPQNRLAINIAKGNEGTGDPEAEVATASEKGICTENALKENQLVLGLPVPDIPVRGRPTWYLLIRRFPGRTLAELSLPVGLTEKRISLWRERIILPMIGDDSVEDPTAGHDDGGFEVVLSRKK